VLPAWLAHWLGLDNVSGPPYAWWSGSGSVLIPLAVQLLIVGLLWWWHHQCTVHRCWWPARRKTAAGERACWRHHPEPRPTAGDVHAAHHAAKGVK
jgi:hypothetical protein